MLKKLKRLSEIAGINCLIIKQNIENFIKVIHYRLKLGLAAFINNRGLKHKTKSLFLVTIPDILFTGALIWYIISFRNFVSYGLVFYIVTKYISWFVSEIIRIKKA